MTADFINPTTSGHQDFDDEELAAEGVGPEVLDVRTKDIGVIVLAQPKATKQEYIDAGLTIVLVNDERHDVCPDEPHSHDHAPIASGRLTYSKAMNLASALIQMCIPMTPLDKTEESIVARINDIMEQHQRDAEATVYAHERGPYNVI